MARSRDLGTDELTMDSLVSGRATTAPTSTAVRCGTRALSYRELDTRVGRLAGYLVAHGVRPGDLVAVCLPRSVDLIVGILAVLRANATYLALDPTGPERPLREAVRRCDPAFLVTWERFRVRLADVNAAGIRCVDTDQAAIAASEPRSAASAGAGPACVVYTGDRSARFDHQDMIRAHRDWARTFELDATDRVLSTAAVDSAGFTTDWVRALGSGSTLVITESEFTGNHIASLDKLVKLAHAATVMDCDTRLARLLLRRLAVGKPGRLRVFAVSGDRWYVDQHRAALRILGPGARVAHVYRTAGVLGDVCRMVWTTQTVPPDPVGNETSQCVVGRPVTGMRVSLVSRAERPVSSNQIGEIRVTVGGRHVYTGDLGRRLSGNRFDGHVEYIGGTDRGIGKLRARDVATVEAVLRTHRGVWEAVVVPAPDRPSRPVVYVTPEPGGTVDLTRVRRWYEGRYGRPRAIVRVSTVPRTRSGAVDVDRLPPPPTEHPRRTVGKGGADLSDLDYADRFLVMLGVAAVVGLVAFLLTGALWPGSTDTSLVAQPYAALFHVLYVFEAAGFGLGVGYLFVGYPWLASYGRGTGLTVLTHLAVAWLLLSWWPQDNFYRLASKTDYPRQAALVYGFNITLIIAGVIVLLFLFAAATDPDEQRRRPTNAW